jgi:hypothetical protein
MRLLLVHGRAQEGKSSEIIEAEWMNALRRGFDNIGFRAPADLKIDAPFYGDKLIELLKAYDLPAADQIATRGGAVDDGYAAFLTEVAEQAAKEDKVTAREIDKELDGEVAVQDRGPQNWSWVQAVIRVIDRHTPDISSFTIGQVLRDVYVYVNSGPVQRAINLIVAGKLTNEPTVVIAHSLGTVVGYQVLRQHAGNAVPRLVTVGSPLGIRAIRDRLPTPLTMPAGIRNWYNAFDTRDVVALYALDANNFDLKPPIDNYALVNNHTDNRHGIDGYLDDLQVARHVADAIAAV